MPALDAIIQYGELSDVSLVDEPSLLVQSLEITPARDKKDWKGANQATRALRYTNPTLKFDFNAIISDLEEESMADQHPGTQVLSLANYTGAIYGFDSSLGIMVFEDPSRSYSLENPAETKFSVVQYPFIGEVEEDP
ncbi:MAG: hypothetical protein QM680_06550 [Luteolibacter sp.]